MGKKIIHLAVMMLIVTAVRAQVTTTSIVGFVKDAAGKGLVGANIQAVHEPTGSRFRTQTGTDGRYTLPQLRVGGPYTIVVTYIGFSGQTIQEVTTQLGEPTRVDFALAETNNQMQEITVTGTRAKNLISKERKGTATNINRRVLASMPTLSRNITDFTKLTPQSNGTSFAGQDNRFINLTIDGSIFNNSFGLQALPGSQTNASPISMDAIEEIQVNLSPYNVREAGFTGAGINAVTRSGTNTLHGSGFYNTRTEKLVGTKAGLDGKNPVVVTAFDVKQFGGSLGGALIKNKLFFFANYEGERRNDPGVTFVANEGQSGSNVTRVKKSDLDSLSDFLKSKFSYDPGAYQGYSLATKSDKALLKFDWNISDKHRLSFRTNILKSQRDVPISNSGGFAGRRDNLTAMTYANSNYEIHNDIYSGILQLNSRLRSNVTNELIVGYTANRDYRVQKSPAFPTVDILSGGDFNYITFGSEPFTPNNVLNTDTYQFSDNLTIFKGKHTFSFGVNYERFKFFNQFTPTINGQYVFNSLADFYTSANAYLADPNMAANPVNLRRYNLTYSNMAGAALWNAVTKANNLGFYGQDEWAVRDNLSMTFGLRVDVPFFSGGGMENTEVAGMNFVNEKGEAAKLSTSKLPGAKIMINPRWGFNLDVNGDKKTQVRGGLGLFSGRPAFVWISNQMGNNGVQSGSISLDNAKTYPFSPDVTRNIPTITNPGQPAPSYNIATTENNFRFPQVFRTNLAVDQSLGWGMVASAEVMFTQSLSNVYYYNANLKEATDHFSGPDNRPRFPTFNPATGGLLSGASFNNAIRINPKVTDATVLKSGPYGGSFLTTVKLEKPIRSKGLGFMMAYTYSSAKDYVQAGSIASSSFTGNRSVNGNNHPDLAYTDFDIRSRVIGNINYRLELAKSIGLQFSLFGQSQQQGRASYTYSGDMNGDGISGNDLVYVPKDITQMNFQPYSITVNGAPQLLTANAQKAAWTQYINQDSYLSSIRGGYSARNGLLLPMVTRFDLSAMLELFHNIGKQRHTIQLRADIFNIGNLLNSAWGVGYVINNSSPLAARGYDPATGQPIFRMNTVNNSLNYTTYRRGTSLVDVWQAQFGIRYIF